ARETLHKTGLLAELIERFPEAGFAGIERNALITRQRPALERKAGLPGKIGKGLVQRGIMITQMHALGFEQVSRLDAFLDACRDGFGPPADLRIGIAFRGLQSGKRGRPGGVELARGSFTVLELLASQFAYPP